MYYFLKMRNDFLVTKNTHEKIILAGHENLHEEECNTFLNLAARIRVG